MFKSDVIRIGAGVSVGVGGFVHYGVEMREGAILDADAFLMKGEVAPAHSRWRGNPAKMMGARVTAISCQADRPQSNSPQRNYSRDRSRR